MTIIYWDFDATLVYSNPLWSTTVFNSLNEIDPSTQVKFTEIRKCMAKGFTWNSCRLTVLYFSINMFKIFLYQIL